MIDEFSSVYCRFDGHPRAMFSHHEAATLLTKKILEATKDQKVIVNGYKRANNRF